MRSRSPILDLGNLFFVDVQVFVKKHPNQIGDVQAQAGRCCVQAVGQILRSAKGDGSPV